MSVVFGGLTARAAAVMVMAADSIAELCMNVCRLCGWCCAGCMLPCVQLSRTIVTMSLCAECGSMCPHHHHHHHHHQLSSLTFAVAALLLSCSLLSVTQCYECGEPGAGAAGAGWAGFWAGCCRSCSISMHAPPTSAPPPTVTPHLDTCISTLALDIYTGARYLHWH